MVFGGQCMLMRMRDGGRGKREKGEGRGLMAV